MLLSRKCCGGTWLPFATFILACPSFPMILAAMTVQYLVIYLSIFSCFVQLFPLSLAVFTVPFHNQWTLPALPTALRAGCSPENMALSKEQHVAWVRAKGLVLLAAQRYFQHIPEGSLGEDYPLVTKKPPQCLVLVAFQFSSAKQHKRRPWLKGWDEVSVISSWM